jgi:hypothetical protein
MITIMDERCDFLAERGAKQREDNGLLLAKHGQPIFILENVSQQQCTNQVYVNFNEQDVGIDYWNLLTKLYLPQHQVISR